MTDTLSIPGTGQKIDIKSFTTRVYYSPDSPGKSLLLEILQADAEEGGYHHLHALLASPLKTDKDNNIILQLPDFMKDEFLHFKPVYTTGLRPANHYTPPLLNRRKFATTAAALGGAIAIAPQFVPSSQPPIPDNQLAASTTIQSDTSTSLTLPADAITEIAASSPWPAMVIGGGVATLGFIASRMIDNPKTLGYEVTRRSFLGQDYARAPFDSDHAAYNTIRILNNFLPSQEGSRSHT